MVTLTLLLIFRGEFELQNVHIGVFPISCGFYQLIVVIFELSVLSGGIFKLHQFIAEHLHLVEFK